MSFINKIKKSNKILLALFVISWVVYTFCYVLFVKSLIQLAGIETLLRIILIILFGLWVISWAVVGLIALFSKKYKAYVIMMIFNVIFIAIFQFSSYYIDVIYNELSEFSKNKITYTTVLVNLKDNEFNENSKIGMIDDVNDLEGNTLPKDLIKEHNLKNEVKSYNDYYDMLYDLYNNKIDAIFLSGNYVVLFQGEEDYTEIANDTKVVYQLSKEMDNKDNVVFTNKKLTEPFTILFMGVDSETDGLNANQAFNGDTLMMITFNPKTLTATVFSVPRDTYVPIACRNNAYAKINSSAAYGTNCVISTLKNLTDIDIDYYVKINFKGVVDLVNSLGGIEINVEEPDYRYNVGIDWKGKVCEQNSSRQFGNNMVCLDPGYQTLNGEQALAYSRNRHQYVGSDLSRIRHQQEVVAALLVKVKTLSSFEQFTNLLDVIQKNIDTNLTTEQILSLYSVAKSIVINNAMGNAQDISLYKTYLETYSLPVWTGKTTTSALGYYKGSMDDITKIMKINLEQEKQVWNKTFDIDYNEDYEPKTYGKGIRTNAQEKTMPNLVGKTPQEAKTWANSNGLTASIETVTEQDEHYNSDIAPGLVGFQSIQTNTLLLNQSSITFYVNSGTIQNNQTNNTNENENKETNTSTTTTDVSDPDEEKKDNDIVINNEE